MTTYSTRTLSEAVIGDDSKGATRELRKFLRADTIAKGGKVGIDTPGKGGRYSIDLNKRELTALIKRFNAWQAQQEEEKAKRAEALKAAKTPKAPETDNTDDEVIEDDEAETDNALDTVEGPSDEEIAAMLADDDNED